MYKYVFFKAKTQLCMATCKSQAFAVPENPWFSVTFKKPASFLY